uniref:RNase H type-1 domain-containing protein n=1 Tax=Cannabis sativa TaxID=3483 RepID=A0A803QS41_CANSA
MKIGLVEWDEKIITDVLSDRDQALNYASEVVTVAKLNYVYWFNAQKSNASAADINGTNGMNLEHWTAPKFPSIKVNVDGALFTSQGRYGVGLVARTVAGTVLEARILSKGSALQPHVVEAIGIK